MLSKEEILKILDIKSWTSVKIYLSRPEFKHIKRLRTNIHGKWTHYMYDGITDEDINALKNLLHRNRGFNYWYN